MVSLYNNGYVQAHKIEINEDRLHPFCPVVFP